MALVTGNGALLPRPEQSAVLEDAAAGRDTVVGFSTGAGKSLCFLYGGLLRRGGLTLVIGPLVATNAELVAKLNHRAREHEGGGLAGPIADALGGAAVADPADPSHLRPRPLELRLRRRAHLRQCRRRRRLLERFDGRAFSSARALFARLKKGWTCPMIDLENLWMFGLDAGLRRR
jgi:hypothetical protein